MIKEKIKGHTTARSKKIRQRKNLTGNGKYTVKAVDHPLKKLVQFSSVQSLSRVQLFATP